ncbi:MAG: hypothetical protein IJU76_13290 [Desulfovibrionaceae bacterium]|nr:hypothetical protein [Desulfovibrionaceae bacterium]
MEDDVEPWSVETLSIVMSFHAEELAQLLGQTNGHPEPAQLWGVLHGGHPPHDLTMDNFTGKLMQRLSDEIIAFQSMLDNPQTSLHEYLFLAHTSVGIPADTLIDKFSNAQHEDVTITMQDQKMTQGLFNIGRGTQYLHGKHAYGFGFDFIRAGMPPGAKLESDEGCKITIVNEGHEEVFTQQEYIAFNESEAAQGRTHPKGELGHPYIDKIVNAARSLCQNDAQLSSVGYCTTQGVQMALRNAGIVYKDITGGGREHTALDHRIEKQEDGSVKVSIKEKPGSLFKFNMEITVDTQGNTTMTKGEITFPSLDKWNAYKNAHPEERLR